MVQINTDMDDSKEKGSVEIIDKGDDFDEKTAQRQKTTNKKEALISTKAVIAK